jgi:uncharacterized protein YbjT (DUF2867 family)
MIVVLGATGNLGSKVTAKLQETNTPFLGITSAGREMPGFRRGDLMDRGFLTEILSEATSLFSILPGSVYPVWDEYAALLKVVIEKSMVSQILKIIKYLT